MSSVHEIETTVRDLLEGRAAALEQETPPFAEVRRHGRRRRLARDLAAGVGAMALAAGAVLTVQAVHGPSARVSPAVPGTNQSATSSASAIAWVPGPKLTLPTYTTIPAEASATEQNANALLSDMGKGGHPVNVMTTTATGTCLTLGSSPFLWPKGYYAEGSPLTVFDPGGHAVYVLNVGFTGRDGTAQIGYPNGIPSGASLGVCPDIPYPLMVVFKGASGS